MRYYSIIILINTVCSFHGQGKIEIIKSKHSIAILFNCQGHEHNQISSVIYISLMSDLTAATGTKMLIDSPTYKILLHNRQRDSQYYDGMVYKC